MRTYKEYRRLLQSLFPRGKFWTRAESATLTQVLNGLGEELSRVEGRAENLIIESIPSRADETLEEWEEDFNLPEFGLSLADSTAGRQASISAKHVAVGQQNKEYFEEIALALGYNISVTEFQKSLAGIVTAGHDDIGVCINESGLLDEEAIWTDPIHGIDDGEFNLNTLKLCSSFDGVDGSKAYTDPIQGAATFVGTAQLDTEQKKFGTTSLLLDGNSDYITFPDSDDWYFGAGAFTIDMWVRFNSVAVNCGFISQYPDADNWVQFGWIPGGIGLFFVAMENGNLLAYYKAPWNPVVDTWYHVALSRIGSSIYMFVDGSVLPITITAAITDSTSFLNLSTSMRIGICTIFANMYHNGWIDDVKIQKGAAAWIANFTIPTSAATYDRAIYLNDSAYVSTTERGVFYWLVNINVSKAMMEFYTLANISLLISSIESKKPAHSIVLFRFVGVEFSNAFSQDFDSVPWYDGSSWPISFSRDFSSDFANAYDYDGVRLVGSFSNAFSEDFDSYRGGCFSFDEFSTAFLRPS